ncbi:MAG: metal-dependent hydrolase [Acinetobacter venetianus]|uniref:metal-dependent hydrolase n=1 Tax=Acinetobacter venetianus TaxID=52133 RepID=UPI003C759C28
MSKAASKADWEMIPRKVDFKWDVSPLQWIPQDPFASHGINHFSFTLVRGEFFFCRMLNQALPYITDEKLKQDAKIFIRQEAIHSQAHKVSIDEYLVRYGVNTTEQYQRVVKIFDNFLLDDPLGYKLPKRLQRGWLNLRVGVVAAAEHFTSGLGQYVLTRSHWEARGCDPVVSDLFTWHSAEEVEHRTVAFDVYQNICGNYALRALVMGITAPLFTYLMAAGTVQLAMHDSSIPKKQKSIWRPAFWKAWHHSDLNSYVPGPLWYLVTTLRYFKPSYHPYYEASTELAQAYLSQSKGVVDNQQTSQVSKKQEVAQQVNA